MTASAFLEQHLGDLLARRVAGTDVEIDNKTGGRGALLLAGPNARAILEEACQSSFGKADLAGAVRGKLVRTTLGLVPVTLARLSAVGGAGWEIHAEAPYMLAIFEALQKAGHAHGLVNAGARAFDALRIEMGMARWGVDFGNTTAPAAIGLDRYVDPAKGEFTGKAAFLAAKPPESVLVLLEIAPNVTPRDLDPVGVDTVRAGEEVVGMTTSAGFGHRAGARLALAFVNRAHAKPGTALSVEVMDRRLAAKVATPPRTARA